MPRLLFDIVSPHPSFKELSCSALESLKFGYSSEGSKEERFTAILFFFLDKGGHSSIFTLFQTSVQYRGFKLRTE